MLQWGMIVASLIGCAAMMAIGHIEAGALYAVTASIWGLAFTIHERK